MLRDWISRSREWRERLLGAFRPRPADDELKQELDYHLSMAEEDLARRGYSPEEAARLARARHGRAENALERLRDQRGVPLFGVFTLDVKLGLRMLRKQLGLSLVGGIAMTVGIGIISSVFMFFDVVMWATAIPLESVGAFRTVGHDLYRGDGETERVQVAEMSAAGFRVARVSPVLGRTLLPEDEQPGAEPVIVLGFDEWQSRFAGDADVLGRTVRLEHTSYTVVGVMPEDFGFPINHRLWIPLPADTADPLPAPPAGAVFARLAPEASLETAEAEISALGLLPSARGDESSQPPRLRVLEYASNFISDTDPDNLAQRGRNARLVILFITLLLIPHARTSACSCMRARSRGRRRLPYARHSARAAGASSRSFSSRCSCWPCSPQRWRSVPSGSSRFTSRGCTSEAWRGCRSGSTSICRSRRSCSRSGLRLRAR